MITTTVFKEHPHPMTPTTDPQFSATFPEEARAVETMYQAFTDKKPDLLDEACTPDWQDIPLMPGQAPGPAGLKQLMPGFWQAFPDLKIVVHDLVASPGRVGVRASIVGTHLGEIHGVPPTGRPVVIALHEFHHLRAGRITHTWHLEDWFGLLHQVGAWPPAGDAASFQSKGSAVSATGDQR